MHSTPPPHDWRADVRARLASARLHPQDEAEIVEEVAQHLEAQFDELAPRIGPTEARQQLLAQLRDRELDDAAAGKRRRARPSRAGLWRSSAALRDIRYGLRSLRRSPGTVLAGVAALALGIALTTVMFSVIYGLLIKGLPFDDPSRIAMIYQADPAGRGEETLVPFGDFVRYRSEQRSFAAFGGYSGGAASVSGGDRPERVDIMRMTAGAFDVAGVRPMLGRTFTAADNVPGAPLTAVLAYSMWRDRFARDSAALGKSIRVNGRPYTIVGVMPEDFVFPGVQQLWLPLQLDSSAVQPGQGAELTIVARLKKTASYASANAELAGLSERLATAFGDTLARRTTAMPFVAASIPTRASSLLYTMLAGVFLLLLVACANVANLLLDRAVNRTREIGVRVALGASRLAVVRQALVESAILSLASAIAGTALAQAGIVAFNRAVLATGEAPFWTDVRLHPPVLIFVLAVAVIASILSGLLPAIHSARLDINTILKDESHAASSLRVGRISRTIVVGEIALSSALLLGAGFTTKSIVQMRALDPHFAVANVFTARTSIVSSDSLARQRFFETLEQSLVAVPGLQGVSLSNDLPGTGWRNMPVAIEGRVYERERDYPRTRSLAVSSGFFTTFAVAPLSGRVISPTDRRGALPVAVVSESFARRQFHGEGAIGKRIRLGAPPSANATEPHDDWLTIVGVVPTLYAASATSAMGDHFPPEVLTAFWQQPRISAAAIAVHGPPSVANAATLRSVTAAIDPDVPIFATSMMDDVLAKPMWPVRVFGSMFVIFGLVSLVLAAIGLYAVMAFSVTRRTREMGIRMALGATSRHVVAMICRQGVTQILIGMSVGFVAGAALVRLMTMLLFEVRPSDPTVFVIVGGVLAAAAFMACFIPALATTRLDPVAALRGEQ
jgi:putative ABC transport system permease protein